MKTLKNHIILFDNECPMCFAYTKTFVSTGMLEHNGCIAYQNMPETICSAIDNQRAVNEIALVNTESGEVVYGIHSIFKILGHSMPFFNPLFTFAPFAWLMSKFYAFISYNRKIIIPAKVKTGLQPSFKLHYRLAYLFFTWLATAFILTKYAQLLTDFVPLGSIYREYFICGGQLFFQGAIISFYKKDKRWNYLGNMMTISFAGALLLSPILFVAKYAHPNPIFFMVYFLLVAGLMLLEHARRAKILNLGWLLSLTWVAYRLIVLALIFIL